jgi:hypothetical protein
MSEEDPHLSDAATLQVVQDISTNKGMTLHGIVPAPRRVVAAVQLCSATRSKSRRSDAMT